MKHGIAFRKLSRTSSHRMLMLRNLVSSLLQREQIKTTLPKAKETARLAEKIISLAKKGDLNARQDAEAFLLEPHPVPLDPSQKPQKHPILHKLFTTYRERYMSRPGGYTRIHRYGYRQGDHAPLAILELVDGARDLDFAMAARAVGRETASSFAADQSEKRLREKTKLAVEKVLKFRGEEGRQVFEKLAQDHANRLLAEPRAFSGLFDRTEPSIETGKRRIRAGERLTGMSTSATGLRLAKGSLGRKPAPKIPRFWQKGWQQKVGLPAPAT